LGGLVRAKVGLLYLDFFESDIVYGGDMVMIRSLHRCDRRHLNHIADQHDSFSISSMRCHSDSGPVNIAGSAVCALEILSFVTWQTCCTKSGQ
jgi:hypothetical protein